MFIYTSVWQGQQSDFDPFYNKFHKVTGK